MKPAPRFLLLHLAEDNAEALYNMDEVIAIEPCEVTPDGDELPIEATRLVYDIQESEGGDLVHLELATVRESPRQILSMLQAAR